MFFYLIIIIRVYRSFGSIHLTRNTSNHDFKELSLSYIPGKDKLLEGSCPDFKQFQIQDFDISLYDGVWYELGVKDFLQLLYLLTKRHIPRFQIELSVLPHSFLNFIYSIVSSWTFSTTL